MYSDTVDGIIGGSWHVMLIKFSDITFLIYGSFIFTYFKLKTQIWSGHCSEIQSQCIISCNLYKGNWPYKEYTNCNPLTHFIHVVGSSEVSFGPLPFTVHLILMFMLRTVSFTILFKMQLKEFLKFWGQVVRETLDCNIKLYLPRVIKHELDLLSKHKLFLVQDTNNI